MIANPLPRKCKFCNTVNDVETYEGLGNVCVWSMSCRNCGTQREGFLSPDEVKKGIVATNKDFGLED
jgi:hypothetical protein